MGFHEQAVVIDRTPPEITGTRYFLLLAMANKTTELGYVWASVDELARDLRTSRRTIQRLVHQLLTLGQLELVDWDTLPPHLPKPGAANRRPNLYRITVLGEARDVSPSPRGANLSPLPAAARGDTGAPRGDIEAPRGDIAMSPNRESERESERDSDARTRAGPATSHVSPEVRTGRPTPIAQLLNPIRSYLVGDGDS